MTTLYITDELGAQKDLVFNLSGSSTLRYTPGQTGIWNWYAEKFSYYRQSGTFDIAIGGSISINPNFARDFSISQLTEDTVAAYTSFANLDQLYDFSAHKRVTDPKYILASASAGTLFFNCDIIINASAVSVWSYNSVTNTLTIKASILNPGSINTQLNTTGTVTLLNNAKIYALYSPSAGLSSIITYPGLIDSSVLLLDSDNTEYDLSTNLTGIYTEYVSPGATGSWSWFIERYGFQRQTGNFLMDGGGSFTALPSWSSNSSITSSKATISSLTSYTSLDQVYDREEYERLSSPLTVYNSKAGSQLILDFPHVIFDKNAVALRHYESSTGTLTLKADVLNGNTIFTSLHVTGTLSFINGASATCVYSDSTGSTSNLKINNLVSSTVYITDGSGIAVDTLFSQTGVYTSRTPLGASGSYTIVVERLGYTRQTFNVDISGGGEFSIAVVYIPDVNMVVKDQAVLAAYLTLDTPNEEYDYGCYQRLLHPEYNFISKDGVSISLGSFNHVIDATASSVWSITGTTLTTKSSALTRGTSLYEEHTNGLITAVNGATIGIPIKDALGARATILNLDPQNFGITWYLKYRKVGTTTWTYESGTGNYAALLVDLDIYEIQIRAPGYTWVTRTMDTSLGLTLDANLSFQVAKDNVNPQYTKPYDVTKSNAFQFDAIKYAVEVTNTTGFVMNVSFADLYRALQRVLHLPSLVWIWTSPVKAVTSSETFAIPADNSVWFYLSDDSNQTVQLYCPVIHEENSTSAIDRVKGNTDGFSIILGSTASAETAGLVQSVIDKLGGLGYDSNTHCLKRVYDISQITATNVQS